MPSISWRSFSKTCTSFRSSPKPYRRAAKRQLERTVVRRRARRKWGLLFVGRDSAAAGRRNAKRWLYAWDALFSRHVEQVETQRCWFDARDGETLVSSCLNAGWSSLHSRLSAEHF